MAGSFKISGLPVRARLEVLQTWTLTTNQLEPDSSFHWERSEIGNTARQIDAWRVRAGFLAIADIEESEEFFRKHGPFFRTVPDGLPPKAEQCESSFAMISKYRGWLLAFMTDTKMDWVGGKSWDVLDPKIADAAGQAMALNGFKSPRFTLETGFVPIKQKKRFSPFLAFLGHDVFSAVYASIYIDKMRGFDGRVCKREECRNTFLAQDPRKEYCSPNCSALVRVRRSQKLSEVSNGKA